MSAVLSSLSMIFMSIIIEALPFVFIGVFVSAIIQNFISEETIRRILPRNPLTGVVMAGLTGIIFPVCECGIIPIVRRLIKKGVPPNIGITLMLAIPIVNPVVGISTYFAFAANPQIALLRMILGFTIAVLIGLLLIFLLNTNPLRNHHSHSGCGCGCGHTHNVPNPGLVEKVYSTLLHAGEEFFDMGKYLILGAFLTALMQTFIPRAIILSIGQDVVSSNVAMMLMAFVMSICSEADAFVAASFQNSFTVGSILSFLVYGPMIDIKNTFMLFGTFKTRFSLLLIGLITVLVFIGSYLVNLML